jgi:membrane protein DedA with SNARE-associated domain
VKDARRSPSLWSGEDDGLEAIVTYLSGLDPFWVYVAVGSIAFIENVFPPFPSDVLVVAAGSFAAGETVDPVVTVAVATGGSTLGFFTMYLIGEWFGRRILDTGKLPFIPLDRVATVEAWFRKYGYAVVVVNRFLAGTRAVVSFFAGISDLRLLPCLVLSFFSALVWNTLLVIGGFLLGDNWREIMVYLQSYGQAVTGLLIVSVLVYVGYRIYRKRTQNNAHLPPADE